VNAKEDAVEDQKKLSDKDKLFHLVEELKVLESKLRISYHVTDGRLSEIDSIQNEAPPDSDANSLLALRRAINAERSELLQYVGDELVRLLGDADENYMGIPFGQQAENIAEEVP